MPIPDSKLLLLTPTLQTIGGVENYYNALELHRHDNRIDYFFVTADREESVPALIYRLARNYLRFVKLIAGSDYGFVVINPSLNRNSFYRDAIFCWLALLRGKRVLIFFRGWSERFESQILRVSIARYVFRCTFKRVRNFIVLGASFKHKLVRMGCAEQARFWIESTVADTSYLREFSIQIRAERRSPFRMLFLSRMTVSKGTDIAVHAFQLACERLPQVPMELIMAGDGPDLARLRSLVKTEGIRDVRFTGVVSGTEKKQVIFDADILLFPTMHDEGMPNVVLEAMLYGLPIVSRTVGAIPDIVTDGENGYLTNEIDPNIFANLIVTLATNSDLRYQISIANHEKALRSYATDIVRGRLLRIFDTVLAS